MSRVQHGCSLGWRGILGVTTILMDFSLEAA